MCDECMHFREEVEWTIEISQTDTSLRHAFEILIDLLAPVYIEFVEPPLVGMDKAPTSAVANNDDESSSLRIVVSILDGTYRYIWSYVICFVLHLS